MRRDAPRAATRAPSPSPGSPESFQAKLAAIPTLEDTARLPNSSQNARMNTWESELFMHEPVATAHSSEAQSLPASLAVPMDQDALFEALVFMDDLGLDDHASVSGLHSADMNTTKHQSMPPFADMSGGPLSATSVCDSLFDMNALIPEDAYTIPDHTMQMQLYPDTTPQYQQHQVSGITPVPASPPVSTSSTSPPSSPAPSTVSDTTTTVSVTSGNGGGCGVLTTDAGKPKGVVNRSRNRRREELTYLRTMVSELEERLTTVRKRADDHQQIQNGKLLTGEPLEDDPVMAAVWEDMAQRQLAQRQRAEVENAKLRRMLEDQIQVGKSLERLLKKRGNTEDVDLQLNGKRARRSSMSLSWNNAAIFGDLLANIPAMYEQTDRMFSKHSFTRSPANFRDIQVLNDPEVGMMLEIVEAHAFPFDYELTAENFWTLFTIPTEKDRFHYHDANIEDDTLKVQFGLTVQVARARGEFNLKVASRRFTEANRTVIVWTGFSDPTEVSDTNMDGIYMRHRGWTIVEPITSNDKDADGGRCLGTRTRSYSTAIPEAFEDVPDQKRKVGTLTNFMLTTTDVQISSRIQMLENRLLELSLESSSD